MKKQIIILVLAVCFATGSGYAQQLTPQTQSGTSQQQNNFSDAELKKFLTANQEAQKIQKQSQDKMITAINDAGLEVKEFKTIVKSLRSKQSTGASDISQEKKQKAQKASQKIAQIQTKMQKDIQAEIKAAGLSTKKFQQIMMAYRNDKELQQRIQNLRG